MLQELVVEGLGVIDRAEVRFARGSTALTGETGAGKTLVVAAVALLRGGRADKGAVRSGASRTSIEGRFAVPFAHPAVSKLIEMDLIDPADDAGEGYEVVVSRVVTDQGSRARINGRMVTAAAVADVMEGLIEIAGQNEHQRLASGTHQRDILDTFAGSETFALRSQIAHAVEAAHEASARAEQLRSSARTRERRADVLRFEVKEIEDAAPLPGEWADLTRRARRLENAESISNAIEEALATLREEGAAEDLITGAAASLRRGSLDDGRLEALAGRLEAARIEIADIAGELAALVEAPDPHALDEARTRLDALARLRRKYGDDEEAVLAYLEAARSELDSLAGEAADATVWEERAAASWAQAREHAEVLTRRRAETASRLETEVGRRLSALALPGARFKVELHPRELGKTGAEDVAFLVALEPDGAPRPIAKAVSGGELARISLALHLACASPVVSTMIFDEVDAGVGGKVAQDVGLALAELADLSGGQVVVVTHLPQVAAFADHHLRVVKDTSARGSAAHIEVMGPEERIEELSRMLAGMPESPVGREHARELLALAGRKQRPG